MRNVLANCSSWSSTPSNKWLIQWLLPASTQNLRKLYWDSWRATAVKAIASSSSPLLLLLTRFRLWRCISCHWNSAVAFMNVQKDSKRWKKAPMTVITCLRSILVFLDIGRQNIAELQTAILMSACDFLFGKDLPPNLDFFLQNCRNLIGWVTIPAKIMQECRFDPYMGNDLVCVVRCPITPYHIREINRFFNSVMPQVLSLFKATETGTK